MEPSIKRLWEYFFLFANCCGTKTSLMNIGKFANVFTSYTLNPPHAFLIDFSCNNYTTIKQTCLTQNKFLKFRIKKK